MNIFKVEKATAVILESGIGIEGEYIEKEYNMRITKNEKNFIPFNELTGIKTNVQDIKAIITINIILFLCSICFFILIVFKPHFIDFEITSLFFIIVVPFIFLALVISLIKFAIKSFKQRDINQFKFEIFLSLASIVAGISMFFVFVQPIISIIGIILSIIVLSVSTVYAFSTYGKLNTITFNCETTIILSVKGVDKKLVNNFINSVNGYLN